jgi:hypothetical protein
MTVPNRMADLGFPLLGIPSGLSTKWIPLKGLHSGKFHPKGTSRVLPVVSNKEGPFKVSPLWIPHRWSPPECPLLEDLSGVYPKEIPSRVFPSESPNRCVKYGFSHISFPPGNTLCGFHNGRPPTGCSILGVPAGWSSLEASFVESFWGFPPAVFSVGPSGIL